MTDMSMSKPQGAKSRAVADTLKCVAVLTVIAVVCVTLLAVANKFMKVVPTLDKSTCAKINALVPTGVDDGEAFSGGYIKMVDLSAGEYALTDIAAYNKKYGSSTRKVRALYKVTDLEGKTTLVVESEGKGYVDAIVMLVAYDADGRVSALTTKSQSESFWSHISDLDALYAAYVGTSGTVSDSDIAATTHVTVGYTLSGMTSAVNIANDFVARLGAEGA